MKKRYLLVLVIIGFALVFWLLFKDAAAPVTDVTTKLPEPSLAPDEPAAKIEGLIVVDSPLPNSSVSSPLVVKGQARGNWYFEASFPIELRDSSGNLLGSGIASAQGEWMTEEYVPFTASLKYDKTAEISGKTGFLILKKDNPSGDPSRDQSLKVPVKL